jgi:hypothetical protein
VNKFPLPYNPALTLSIGEGRVGENKKYMEPSKDLIKAIETLTELRIENLKQWTVLFSNIPLYRWCQSSVPELADKDINVDYEDPNYTGENHIFYVLLDLEKRIAPDDDDVVGCQFNPSNKARIERADECDHDRSYPELEAIGFFGFEGTWDEVVFKMVQGARVLTQPPPTTMV